MTNDNCCHINYLFIIAKTSKNDTNNLTIMTRYIDNEKDEMRTREQYARNTKDKRRLTSLYIVCLIVRRFRCQKLLSFSVNGFSLGTNIYIYTDMHRQIACMMDKTVEGGVEGGKGASISFCFHNYIAWLGSM
jgi:hypothetical protein